MWVLCGFVSVYLSRILWCFKIAKDWSVEKKGGTIPVDSMKGSKPQKLFKSCVPADAAAKQNLFCGKLYHCALSCLTFRQTSDNLGSISENNVEDEKHMYGILAQAYQSLLFTFLANTCIQ